MGALIGRVAKGMLAGVVGTAAMDLVWYQRYRRGGGDQNFAEWDLASGTESFDDASAPGQVGKKIADTVGVDLPDDQAATSTNVMHWLTGIGYGVGHALLNHDRGVVTGGLLTGTGAWLNSYAAMGMIGIYDPIWEYDAETLVKDWTAHLGFGFAAAATYAALRNDDDG